MIIISIIISLGDVLVNAVLYLVITVVKNVISKIQHKRLPNI